MKNLIIAIVIIGFAIYSVVLYNKNQELNRNMDTLIQVASEEMNTQTAIDNCISSAYEVYMLDWNTACNSLKLGNDCLLPTYKSDRIDQGYKEAKDMCIERYK